MLPEQCAVRIVEPSDEFYGEIAFINTQPQDTTQSGFFVPEGWYEVVLDPFAGGWKKELYREENLELCGC
jgi:hypothetical protein